jgi:hypothetical protein
METNSNGSRANRPRTSDASINTTSSTDSGYLSGLADTSSPKGCIGNLFGLGTAFRRSRERLDISRQTSQRSGSTSITTTQYVLFNNVWTLANVHRECVSCLDDFNSKDLIPLACHSYCKQCFQTLIRWVYVLSSLVMYDAKTNVVLPWRRKLIGHRNVVSMRSPLIRCCLI